MCFWFWRTELRLKKVRQANFTCESPMPTLCYSVLFEKYSSTTLSVLLTLEIVVTVVWRDVVHTEREFLILGAVLDGGPDKRRRGGRQILQLGRVRQWLDTYPIGRQIRSPLLNIVLLQLCNQFKTVLNTIQQFWSNVIGSAYDFKLLLVVNLHKHITDLQSKLFLSLCFENGHLNVIISS